MTAALDRRADAVISKYMWAAGSATAVNPIPLLDVAGGSAVTVKMVLDLAHIYKQPIDADTVVTMLSQLGKNLVAMLGVPPSRRPRVGRRDASEDVPWSRHDRRWTAARFRAGAGHPLDRPRLLRILQKRNEAAARWTGRTRSKRMGEANGDRSDSQAGADGETKARRLGRDR